jgi:hypothetical protein
LPQPSASGQQRQQVELNNFNYDGNILQGEVINRTGRLVSEVTVNYQLLNIQGQGNEVGFITVQPSSISPEGTARFQQQINNPNVRVSITSIRWK